MTQLASAFFCRRPLMLSTSAGSLSRYTRPSTSTSVRLSTLRCLQEYRDPQAVSRVPAVQAAWLVRVAAVRMHPAEHVLQRDLLIHTSWLEVIEHRLGIRCVDAAALRGRRICGQPIQLALPLVTDLCYSDALCALLCAHHDHNALPGALYRSLLAAPGPHAPAAPAAPLPAVAAGQSLSHGSRFPRFPR